MGKSYQPPGMLTLMVILGVDTATNYVVAGLCEVDGSAPQSSLDRTSLISDEQSHPRPDAPITQLAARCIDDARGHNEILTPLIMECLDESSLTTSDIDAVVVGTGPGPFTGLRVGMATASAFADALGAPTLGISTLEALAYGALETGDDREGSDSMKGAGTSLNGIENGSRIFVATDARRREVYWAIYEVTAQPAEEFSVGAKQAPSSSTLKEIHEPSVGKPQDIQHIIEAEFAEASGGTFILADAIASPFSDLAEKLGAKVCAAVPSVRNMVRAVVNQPGGFGGENLVRPLYLRRPDAVEPARKPVSTAIGADVIEQARHDFEQSRTKASTPQELAADYVEEGVDGATQAHPDGAPSQPSSTNSVSEPDNALPEGMSLVRLDVTAAQQCAQLEAEIFAEDSPWPLEGFVGELQDPRAVYVGIVLGDALIGYGGLAVLGPDHDPEAEIRTIGLNPAFRGRGLGRLMLETLLYAADHLPAPVYLEVRTDNTAAIGLYESVGFRKTCTRKNYYQPSGADAYTMMREISAGHDA